MFGCESIISSEYILESYFACVLDLEDGTPPFFFLLLFLLAFTLAHDDAPTYKIFGFKRFSGSEDICWTQTDGHGDSNIPPPPPNFVMGVEVKYNNMVSDNKSHMHTPIHTDN